MADEPDFANWQPARLIPTSSKRNDTEEERRATSALLAVLSAVDEFGRSFTKPYGAPNGKLQTFIEVTFELEEGVNVRPDGLIRIARGKRNWTALVEVKTGNNPLVKEQIENYLDVAKKQEFDCVITISNQIARIPGEHPVQVSKTKTKKVALYHLSWSRILTESVLAKEHRGVKDPDQAWILGELIRYLEHPNAGTFDFSDMGEHWVGVRDAAKNGTLRQKDAKSIEIAGKWEELLTFASLRLGRKLGDNVQEVLSTKEKNDISVRIENIVASMANRRRMQGSIRIPNTVGDIVVTANLLAEQVEASITFDAPKTGRSSARINWLLRQLKSSSPETRLESWGARMRESSSEMLGVVRENQSHLIPHDNRDITKFTVALTRPMGIKRNGKKGAFIDSVIATLDDFYGDVVQHLKEWQPPAPKLTKVVQEPIENPAQEENSTNAVLETESEIDSKNPETTINESGVRIAAEKENNG